MSQSNIAANTDDLQGRYLTFYIEEVVYGIELVNVIEIISIQAVTRVPYVPDYVKGIINLRGKIVPVIDVRLKFLMSERDYDEHTSIVVLNYNDMQMGIIVDSVRDVVTTQPQDMAPLPIINDNETNRYLKTVMKVADKSVLTLNLDVFFEEDVAL